MKRFFLAATAVVLLHFGPAVADEADLVRYTLPNGLRVVLAEDHASPNVVVTVGYDVGAKDEPEGRSGFAHLFEHLMFTGTERIPDGEMDALIEGGGGWTNAYTNSDQTVYYASAPGNMLPLLLWIEADRMANFGRGIDQTKLDLQRAVVLNERRQNTEDAPYGEAAEDFNALMFPDGHPYHTGVIGAPTDIEAATVEDVRAFFATYYGPNNAVLVVTGDFDGDALRATIESNFGAIPALAPVPRRAAPADPRAGTQQLDVVDRVSLPLVILGWPAPAEYAPGSAAASVLASLLQQRLESRLVYEEGVANSVGAYVDGRALGSVFTVQVMARAPGDLPHIEQVVDATLADLAQNPPPADDIEGLATSLEYGVLQQLESPTRRAIMLAELELRLGRADGYDDVVAQYRALTPADVAEAAANAVASPTRSIVRVFPAGPTEAAAPEAAPAEAPVMPDHDPGPRPAVGEPVPFTVPEPEIFKLSNGIEVRYWSREGGGITHLAWRFGGGSADDGMQACGAASLLTDVLLEGPEGTTREDFRRSLRAAGATMGAYAHPRAVIVTLDVLTRNAANAVDIVDATLRAPHLDEATVTTLRNNALDYAKTVDDPDTVMWRVLRAQYYGDDSPYRCRPAGTVESLPRIDVPTLDALRDRAFVPGNTTVFAVTDLSKAELQAMLEHDFGAWPAAAGATAPETVYPPVVPQPQRLLIADLPGSAQTRIAVVAPGPGATVDDRAVLEGVVNVLGGSFTSRLNSNLREDKGYTYGISASDDFDPKAPSTWIVTDVQADSTGAALAEILAEVARIETGDITADEAVKVANGQTAALVTNLADPGGLIGLAIDQDDSGRPFDELTARLSAIEGLTAESLNAEAPETVDLDHALILLVGDKDVILEQLSGANLPLPAPQLVAY